MYAYNPKLSHLFITIISCIGCIVWDYGIASTIGAILFALSALLVGWMLYIQALDEHTKTINRFMEIFNRLDDEGRAATAMAFPRMRYRMNRGKVRAYFEDTNATMDHFRLFMGDSNTKFISPERNWNSTDQPRWAWFEIFNWLDQQDYIIPESHAGNHSWKWRGNAYDHLMAYWMADRRLKELE